MIRTEKMKAQRKKNKNSPKKCVSNDIKYI